MGQNVLIPSQIKYLNKRHQCFKKGLRRHFDKWCVLYSVYIELHRKHCICSTVSCVNKNVYDIIRPHPFYLKVWITPERYHTNIQVFFCTMNWKRSVLLFLSIVLYCEAIESVAFGSIQTFSQILWGGGRFQEVRKRAIPIVPSYVQYERPDSRTIR